MKNIELSLIVIFSFSYLQIFSQDVKMYEKEIVIPTYEVGAAEINPIFYTPTSYQGAQNRVYPYKNLDRLSDKKNDKAYKGLFLENNFIKICVLPEIGGRLYIANDKTNNYDFFYYNKVIKPSLIGMAGAWISGGIEWNIPHHHRVSTFMPVDYKMVENADGSKTIWVGEYEKRHRTKWAVGLTLRPGKSYIETTIKYFNVTPQITSLLIWANPAVHVNENYQVIFPPDVEYAVFHAKTEFTNWPVANQFYQGIDFTHGEDVSWWKNTYSPTSFFQYGSEQNFVAGIDHGRMTGTVIVGDRYTCPGKKMWNWGNNSISRLWDQILTDEDGPYIELMAGAYSDNQPDYSWCDPFSAKVATHFYFPIKGMDNIKEANKNGAINLEIKYNKAFIQLNTTDTYSDLILQLSIDGRILKEKLINCNPSMVIKAEFNLPAGTAPELVKVLVLKGQEEIISYQPKTKKGQVKPEPYKPPKIPAEIATVDELYEAGLRLEQFNNAYLNPVPYYEEALKRDPKSIDVNIQMGIHFIKKYEFETAQKYLQVAVEVVTANHTCAKNCEPLYYLGLCYYELGKYNQAYEWLQKAAWSHAFVSPALYLCATIDCKRRDYIRALENLNRSYLENNLNIETQNLKTIVLAYLGIKDEALKSINSSFEIDPVDFIATYEQDKLQENNFQDFIKIMRNEPDNYLEVAYRYTSSGFCSDAIKILEMAANSKFPELNANPMIYYFLAFSYGNFGNSEKAKSMLAKASLLPVDYCFPYGTHCIEVLSEAIKINSDDAKAYYYLGNIYADFQTDKSIAYWEKAVGLDPSLAIAWRNLAGLYAHQKNDMKNAIECIDKALVLNPNDPQYLIEADMYYGYAGISPEKRLKLFTDHQKIIAMTDAAIVKYNNLLVFFGKYSEVLNSLKTRNIHAYERFNTNYHVTWVDANVLSGIALLKKRKAEKAIPFFEAALTFPRNLEIAEDNKARLALYYLGVAYKTIGNAAKADECFKNSVKMESGSSWGGDEWPEVAYSRALSYKALNQNDKANEIFNKLIENGKKMPEREINPVAYTEGVENRWDIRLTVARGYYMQALGNLGLGNKQEATDLFSKSMQTEASFLSAKSFRFEEIF